MDQPLMFSLIIVVVFLAGAAVILFGKIKQLEELILKQNAKNQYIVAEPVVEPHEQLISTTSTLSQLDPRRTYRPEELPAGLNLSELKVLEANLMQNGKTVKINTQQIVVGKPGENLRVNLMTNTPNVNPQEQS